MPSFGKTLWLACVLATGMILPAHAGELFDDEDDKVAEVAPALANVNDRFTTRNQPVDMRHLVRTGEWLKFQVKSTVLSVPLGTIELACRRTRTIQERLAYVVSMESRPNETILNLLPFKVLPVKTTVTTNMDVETGRSLIYSCRENAANGNKSRDESIHFNYIPAPQGAKAPNATTNRNRLRNGKRDIRERNYPIPGDMQDALSMFYYGRGLPLEKAGDQLKLLVGGMSDVAEVTLTVLGEETITLPGIGAVDCVVVQPQGSGDARLASFKGQAKVWMEKKTRIPVRLQLDIDVSLTAQLLEADAATITRLKGVANP